MQTFVSEIVTTFVGDAEALLTGFSRTLWRTLMAPVERIAAASDVAGILTMRGAHPVASATPEPARAGPVM